MLKSGKKKPMKNHRNELRLISFARSAQIIAEAKPAQTGTKRNKNTLEPRESLGAKAIKYATGMAIRTKNPYFTAYGKSATGFLISRLIRFGGMDVDDAGLVPLKSAATPKVVWCFGGKWYRFVEFCVSPCVRRFSSRELRRGCRRRRWQRVM